MHKIIIKCNNLSYQHRTFQNQSINICTLLSELMTSVKFHPKIVHIAYTVSQIGGQQVFLSNMTQILTNLQSS